jgi:hypothetical protein
MILGAMFSTASGVVRAWGVPVVVAALASACSGSSPANPGTELDGGFVDGLPVGEVSCDDDSRVDTYTAHLAKAGAAGLKFEIQSSDPAPPAKGGDTFVVKITDANGQAMTGDLSADLYMPDHGHGTTVEPVITFDPATSTYTLTPLYLFMPGVWRVRLTAYAGSADAGTAIDTGTFYFCIDG